MINRFNPEKLFNFFTPLSPVYSAFMSIRSNLYKRGFFKTKSVGIPLISIGNLTLGGAGKTPFIISLSRYLIKKDLKVGVINRGYKGKSKSWPVLVSNGFNINSNTRDVGDEAILIAMSLPGVIVVSGPDRYEDAKLCEKSGVNLVLMDDGFQHLGLKRDLNILLIDINLDVFKERVFPGGYLRESVKSLNRADCIVFTKTEGLNVDFIRKKTMEIRDFLDKGEIHVFHSENRIKRICTLDDDEINSNDLEKKSAIAFTGIANPYNFIKTVSKTNVNLRQSIFFSDHHNYSLNNLEKIILLSEREKTDYIITTKKDIVKILELINSKDNKRQYNSIIKKMIYIDIDMEINSEFFEYIDEILTKKGVINGLASS